ncbi:RraA family protein [Mycolicibacterium goodii]|uniref:RraA family protein n=1 Tax=Mycolicibacterium goodii TaxID=134601 RepID=UPI00093AC8E4|nr:RraA family protein [Mycolicibacterium goodii]OKH68959.1 hypothetical protein EB74_32025 [Mycobacterium sp. SWH-M5]
MSDRRRAESVNVRFDWATIHDPLPSTDTATIQRFLALDDLSSTVSDVLDEFGVRGAIPASRLGPSMPRERIVGNATTVRNVDQSRSAFAAVSDKDWRMAEILALRTASPGDVLVIEGLAEVSNMGGLMASVAKRQGLAGAIVDGGVRDLGRSRSLHFPVWSRDHTPITGKWRSVTTEVNGTIRLCGVQVAAGDLIIADETGICCIPRDLIDSVLERAEQIASSEIGFDALLKADESVDGLIDYLYGKTD